MTIEEGQKALQLGMHQEIDKEFTFTVNHSFYVHRPTVRAPEGLYCRSPSLWELTGAKREVSSAGKLRAIPAYDRCLTKSISTDKREQEVYRLNVSCFAA
jgi:hypothetical protein